MNDQEYREHRRKQGEPQHLKQRPLMVTKRLEIEAREAARKNEFFERIDRALDNAWRKWGANDPRLHDFIYRALFRRRFGLWPVTGKKTRQAGATGEGLRRLHETVNRIWYPPEVIGGSSRTKTVHAFTGRDDKGNPIRFSTFLHRLVRNRYDGLRKEKPWADLGLDRVEWNDDKDDADGGGRRGGLSSDELAIEAQGTLPIEGAIDSNEPPTALFTRHLRLAEQYRRKFPLIAKHHLAGVTSASEIERLIAAEGDASAPGPRGRKAISRVMTSYKAVYLGHVQLHLKEEQARSIADGVLNPSEAADLNDPKVLERETRRVLGWQPKPKSAVTAEQDEAVEVIEVVEVTA